VERRRLVEPRDVDSHRAYDLVVLDVHALVHEHVSHVEQLVVVELFAHRRPQEVKLKRRLALVQHRSWPLLGLFVALALGVSVLFGPPIPVTLVFAGVLFVVFTRYLPSLVLTRAHARLAKLVLEEDFRAAHAQLDELKDVYATMPKHLEWLRLGEGSILAREGRFKDACALLESLDRRLLGAASVPRLLNSLAWALAHVGRTSEAVTTARESLESTAEALDRALVGEDLRAYQLGTLGTALVLDGQAAEAIAPLEQALARGGRPGAQAIRAFYLGEALRAAGKGPEARKAYARAVEAAPSTDYGKRASAQLETMGPYR
jgi:tetratricopeptide (TPR) repeat protein